MSRKKNTFKDVPKWIKNDTVLPIQYVEIINEVLKKSARKEAVRILELVPDAEREEFKSYFLKKEENNCCNSLDLFKYILVKNNLIEHMKKDSFGHIWFTLEKEENQTKN